MKINGIVNNHQNGCDFHRIGMPLHFIGLSNPEVTVDLIGQSDVLGDFIDCDILFFNRVTGIKASALKFIDPKKVVDLDDFWNLYIGHKLQHHWDSVNMNDLLRDNLEIADAVFTTHSRLADMIYPINHNVIVVPNALPYGEDQFTTDRNPSDKMRFIYAGGDSHERDIKLMSGKFDRIGSDSYLKSRARFVFVGKESRAGVFKKTKSYEIIPYRPMLEYMDVYKEADVALIPLEENEFNSYKSILKILEAGCKKLPCIVSSVLPYTELKHAPGLFWVDKAHDWYYWIKYCVQHPEEVIQAGQELYDYVTHYYSLDYSNEIRLAEFKKITNTL